MRIILGAKPPPHSNKPKEPITGRSYKCPFGGHPVNQFSTAVADAAAVAEVAAAPAVAAADAAAADAAGDAIAATRMVDARSAVLLWFFFFFFLVHDEMDETTTVATPFEI